MPKSQSQNTSEVGRCVSDFKQILVLRIFDCRLVVSYGG